MMTTPGRMLMAQVKDSIKRADAGAKKMDKALAVFRARRVRAQELVALWEKEGASDRWAKKALKLLQGIAGY